MTRANARFISPEDNAVVAELERSAVLGRDEEQILAREFRRTGDRRLADRLVRANLRLVIKIAGEYAKSAELMAELVQQGCLGLVVAVDRFDPDRGVRLCSYASWWIRAEILRYLAENVRVVNISRSRDGRQRFFRGELAGPDLSLDAQPDDGRPPLVDRMSGDEDARPDHLVERADLACRFDRVVASARATGSDRERALFDERLLAEDPRTLGEIARRFAVTKERMRQIERRMLDRLRTRTAALAA